MPIIYDNIKNNLQDGLNLHIKHAARIDACVGYFNLRGWSFIADQIDSMTGDDVIEQGSVYHRTCRLIVGMVKTPKEYLMESFFTEDQRLIDNPKAAMLKKQLAEEFKQQLTIGVPSTKDEETLKKLIYQLKANKIVVKLFLRHPLHAKLYLTHETNGITPKIGLLGSSNLTFSGMSGQGELNIDVLEQDAAGKLDVWFNDRWNDRWCLDITDDLINVLESSWATDKTIPPYHIYLKMAYHLSREARTGINEFSIPKIIEKDLLDFQQKAVLIAANHLNKRGGVIIGDVVGLGKTITATALAKIFEEDLYFETLIICPKNLTKMWDDYVYKYQLHAKVMSLSVVINELKELRRYRLVIIDESHNLRNREGRRYQAIKGYLEKNDSKVVLLTATPYNMSYVDLSNQLRLFLADDLDLGISPEHYISSIGGARQFNMKHPGISLRSISAFEKSVNPDDWRELMKLYLVRRTRSFVKQYYSNHDDESNRDYLTFSDGRKSYFTERIPRKIEFKLDSMDKTDQYAMLYSEPIVEIIDNLNLPRYGLGNYIIDKSSKVIPSAQEAEIIKNLSRAGSQLIGFCRTNLFKRLESSGFAFLLSLSRHLLRNFIFIYAIEHKQPIPIGKQYMNFFDEYLTEGDNEDETQTSFTKEFDFDEGQYLEIAKEYYDKFINQYNNRFHWLRSELLKKEFLINLKSDCKKILSIIEKVENWDSERDRKLNALYDLVTKTHSKEKVLIFTQFADTAEFLGQQLKKRGVKDTVVVTGDCDDIVGIVRRFSPISNEKPEIVGTKEEIRILITTDVLSEGQNLQDSHVVLNYDLPWAIIRLIQRAGRVDRIGQTSPQIQCYSFLPEDGIELIINLRSRLRRRISQNAEVVGSDEVFFDGDPINIADLYSEKAGILDEDDEGEIDLASYAYQIWKNATENDHSLIKKISEMSNVVFSAKRNTFNKDKEGAIVYAKTAQDNDVLTWINKTGEVITQSQYTILRAAECSPDTSPIDKLVNHHELVKVGIDQIVNDEQNTDGTLGKKGSVKYRAYMSLKRYYDENEGTLFVDENLKKAIDEIYRFPLRENTIDTLGRQLKIGISDYKLAELVKSLREESKLCVINEEETTIKLPQIICSLGMVNESEV